MKKLVYTSPSIISLGSAVDVTRGGNTNGGDLAAQRPC
ncbi:hypothetical protein SAMN05428987_5280 [Paenibacillus sp. CF095]|nr:hypothetical protein SAMN05428987_5280 [Paenibacillus sp. CF095]